MKSPIDKQIILASNSPRRRELLSHIAPDYILAPAREIDESYPANLEPENVAPYLSTLKAEAYSDLIDDRTVLITADTVVIIDGTILGKPHSTDEAIDMLKKLSGRTHCVVTGVTLRSANNTRTFSCATQVHFDTLTDDEIHEYVDQYKPFDKAGAYGIQEWIGCRGIAGINGCFYNVMGLPVNVLYNELKTFR